MRKKNTAHTKKASQPKVIPLFPNKQAIDPLGGDIAPQPLDDLGQAQELMYDAWDAPTRDEAVALAHEALGISNNCADAYNLLATEEAGTVEERLAFYLLALKAGERALGQRAFREDRGSFWGILETRPYMRARAGLASTLWRLGQRREAIEHYQDMLRLNPNDNQGIRYLLLPTLIEQKRIEEAENLWREYEDDGMACWPYCRALLDFIVHGGGPAAKASLKKAMNTNKHIPAFLLGLKEMPDLMPDMYSRGDESEAVGYVECGGPAWEATPGALEWLKSSYQ